MKKAKILIRKGKKAFIEEQKREVTIVKEKEYYVDDLQKDFQTQHGIIKKSNFRKKDGSVVLSDTGKEFHIFTATFLDNYKRIKRLAQIIPLKDIGVIIAYTGINRESQVVEAGTGSGALGLFLASYVNQVVSYDINKKHQDIAKQNKKFLGIKNIKFKLNDIYKGIDEKEVDLLCLDLSEPWKVIPYAEKSVKPGGFVVNYSPTIPQVGDFVNEIKKSGKLAHLKTIEIIQRSWDVEGRKIRPKSGGIGHSGFLTFVRRI